MLHAVVMAGGSGTRFWPKSRRNRPKQLLRLHGDASMLQQTVERIAPMVAPDRTWIITGCRPGRLGPLAVARTARRANVVAEPCPRDTAACVGLAASIVAKQDPDGTMIVMPADHVIRPAEKFLATVRAATLGHRRRPHRLRHLRDQADPSRDRLRLHRARGVVGGPRRDRPAQGRPVPREARPRDRRAVRGRGPIRLELRDLRLEGPGHP